MHYVPTCIAHQKRMWVHQLDSMNSIQWTVWAVCIYIVLPDSEWVSPDHVYSAYSSLLCFWRCVKCLLLGQVSQSQVTARLQLVGKLCISQWACQLCIVLKSEVDKSPCTQGAEMSKGQNWQWRQFHPHYELVLQHGSCPFFNYHALISHTHNQHPMQLASYTLESSSVACENY